MNLPAPDWTPTATEYHSDRTHWSPSMISTFRRSPGLAYRRYITKEASERSETRSLRIGSAVNDLMLGLGTLYVCKVKSRSAKAFRDAELTFPDRFVVTQDEHSFASCVASSITSPRTRAAKVAKALLLNGQGFTEWSQRWIDEEYGVPCKQMIDRLTILRGHPTVVEFKTSRDPSPRGFRRQVDQFGYDRQAGFNVRGVEKRLGERPAFFWVVVRNEEPFEVAVYQDDQVVAEGQRRVEETLSDLGVLLQNQTGDRWAAPWERLVDGVIPTLTAR